MSRALNSTFARRVGQAQIRVSGTITNVVQGGAVLTEETAGWYSVRSGDVEGWVGAVRVEPGSGPAAPGACDGAPVTPFAVGQALRAQVETGCLSVRPSPSGSASVTECVANGYVLEITNGPIEVDGEDWFGVRSTTTGLNGWARAAFLVG